MSIVTGDSEFGRALCKALGLDGKKVKSIALRAAIREPVTVTAEILVIDKEAIEVATLLKRYKLVPADSAERAANVAEVLAELEDIVGRDVYAAILHTLNKNADRL